MKYDLSFQLSSELWQQHFGSSQGFSERFQTFQLKYPGMLVSLEDTLFLKLERKMTRISRCLFCWDLLEVLGSGPPGHCSTLWMLEQLAQIKPSDSEITVEFLRSALCSLWLCTHGALDWHKKKPLTVKYVLNQLEDYLQHWFLYLQLTYFGLVVV